MGFVNDNEYKLSVKILNEETERDNKDLLIMWPKNKKGACQQKLVCQNLSFITV